MIRKTLIAAAALCALSAAVFAPTAEARMRFNGLSANGFTLNGVTLNGFTLNGFTLNGVTLNGRTLNGFTLNSVKFNAASEQGAAAIETAGLLAITLPGGATVSAE